MMTHAVHKNQPAGDVHPDVALAAGLTCPVLISKGTVEERRRIIHQLQGPVDVVTLDCGAVGEGALGEVLLSVRPGTVVLDGVDGLTSSQQERLAEVLERRRQGRGLRVIATTRSPLFQMVTDGQFREDLFYRLNVIHIRLR